MIFFRNPLLIFAAGLLFLAGSIPACAQERGRALTQSNRIGPALVKPAPDVLDIQNSFAAVAEAVKPGVVNISAVQIQTVQNPQEFFFGDPEEFFYRFFGEEAPPGTPRRTPPRQYRMEGTGSGVIIDSDGTILTNHHVIQDATQLTVTLASGKAFKGKVVGTDPRLDLAVIKIKTNAPLPYVPLGDSADMRIGDWVLAVGSPFGFEQTVTAGIVSAIRQSLAIEGKNFNNLIQTDASINRGNSGGPLVNVKGQVVGMNAAIYAPTGVFSGIGFAVPINDVKKVLKELIETGRVERSWLGVEIVKVDEVIAQQFGLKSTEGALVNEVVSGSPAEKAGLKRGDVIVGFDGKKITDVGQLQQIVSATEPNKTVSVNVIRDNDRKEIRLRTEVLPTEQGGKAPAKRQEKKQPSSKRTEWLGATIDNVTDSTVSQYLGEAASPSLLGQKSDGVILVDVPAESVAAEAGLMTGDIVRSINRKPVKNVDDAKKLEIDLKKGVVFDVLRRGRSFYLSYKGLP